MVPDTPPDSEPDRAATSLYRRAVAANRFAGVFAAGVLMMAARRIGSPTGLVLVFVLWVIAPYVLLEILAVTSRGWKQQTRVFLHAEMLFGAVATAVAYVAFGLIRARPVVPAFVLGPVLQSLCVGVSVGLAALADPGRR